MHPEAVVDSYAALATWADVVVVGGEGDPDASLAPGVTLRGLAQTLGLPLMLVYEYNDACVAGFVRSGVALSCARHPGCRLDLGGGAPIGLYGGHSLGRCDPAGRIARSSNGGPPSRCAVPDGRVALGLKLLSLSQCTQDRFEGAANNRRSYPALIIDVWLRGM